MLEQNESIKLDIDLSGTNDLYLAVFEMYDDKAAVELKEIPENNFLLFLKSDIFKYVLAVIVLLAIGAIYFFVSNK